MSLTVRPVAPCAVNGHRDPYRVKYWNIGNEMFGFWQLGYMTPSQYVIKHSLFAKAMKKAAPLHHARRVRRVPRELDDPQRAVLHRP